MSLYQRSGNFLMTFLKNIGVRGLTNSSKALCTGPQALNCCPGKKLSKLWKKLKAVVKQGLTTVLIADENKMCALPVYLNIVRVYLSINIRAKL